MASSKTSAVPDCKNAEFATAVSGQESFLETQPQSQPIDDLPEFDLDYDLIGRLIPATANCSQFMLSRFKQSRKWTLGRNHTNDLVVNGDLLSDFHCTLAWNGAGSSDCEVKLTNISSKGVWVNNLCLENGHNTLLQSGTIISFGQPADLPNGYQYIYKDIEGQSGLHKGPIWRKYDIGQEIGSGTFATVYKCIERATGKEHAVKIIDYRKLHCFSDGEKAAMREISILTKLSKVHHANIVELREHFVGDDSLYLILELVQGGDLQSYIRNRGCMSEYQARRMALQLCNAVAYIHSQEITHRDLKLENIMVTSSDPPDFKIADFGVAKLAGSGTYLKTMCGTPAYIAPEIMLDQPYDSKVDSWSLGIVLYTMMANCSPFDEAPHSGTMFPKVHSGMYMIKWDVLDTLEFSATGKDFLRKLLVPDPRKRANVSDMLKHRWISTADMKEKVARGTSGTPCNTPRSDPKTPLQVANNSEQETRPKRRRRVDTSNQTPPRRSSRLQAAKALRTRIKGQA